MSTAVTDDRLGFHPSPSSRMLLLGTGSVGAALIERFCRLKAAGLNLPVLLGIANARGMQACGDDVAAAFAEVAQIQSSTLSSAGCAFADALSPGDVVVDATASDDIAARHAHWLTRGLHVVTANKLGQGADLSRSQCIELAQCESGVSYGNRATVGAGLPVLHSITQLRRGGDRIHRVEGVLSGTMAWLFNQFDGSRPFSELVLEAQQLGFTEPDPRIDLSGEDVRRKLLIIARASGWQIQADQVAVEPMLTPGAQVHPTQQGLRKELRQLDVVMAGYLCKAQRNGEALRFIARLDASGGAGVGIAALPAHHPLCGGGGTDNRVAIFSDRYQDSPLLIQGPGAGAQVTAAALLDDVLQAASR